MIHLLWLSLAIPIVIHMVHRRKAKQMPFSTLRFLRLVDQRVARRQRLKELLLLALRVLLLAALIGALYRPMLRSATFRGTNIPTTAAIVLDNTYSMRAAALGALRFDEARRAGIEILGALQRGDDALVVPIDTAGDAPDPTTGLAALRDELSAAECGYGTGEAAPAVTRAIEGLTRSTNPRKELYIVSDFQKLSWTDAVAETAGALPPGVPVFLVGVGGDVEDNLAVTDARLGLDVQVAGAASVVFCEVANLAREDAERKIALLVDGEKVAEQEIAVPAGERLAVTFTHVFTRTGLMEGEVRLDPDSLAADDARFFVINVRESLPVLLVDGDPSTVRHLDETFFLEVALKAPAPGGRKLSPIDIHTTTAAELATLRLEDYACVVLANVPRVSGLLADRLRRYVEAGGGLLLFAGNRVDPASWNTALCPVGEAPLMPALLGAVVEAGEEEPEGFVVESIAEEHPVFRSIAAGLDMGAARVERFLATTPHAGRSPAVPLVTLDAGPLLLESRAGAGRVVLCTSTADLDWNNMPARRFFLPLVHQLVYHASGAAWQSESTPVGSPLVVPLPVADGPVEVRFFGPDTPANGEPSAVVTSAVADGANRAVLERAPTPGVYRALYGDGDGGPGQTRLFAVNVDVRESDLSALQPADAREMFGKSVAHIVEDPAGIAGVVRREREGLPLWDDLFALAVILVVMESIVGNVLLKY
jgi:hypothetical protein